MVQPSSLANNSPEPALLDLIATLLKNLHDLIHKIPLPKTTKAKNATISMDDLLQAQKLTDTACSSLQNSPCSMQLTTISEQLEAISAHIGIPAAVLQPGAKRSYAAALSAPASSKLSGSVPIFVPLDPHCPAGPPTLSGPTHWTLLASVLFSSWTLIYSLHGLSYILFLSQDVPPCAIFVHLLLMSRSLVLDLDLGYVSLSFRLRFSLDI